jgi:hypothetical protein
MAAQVLAIGLVIAGIRWEFLAQWGSAAMWAVVLFGVWSAADYFWKFWDRVDQQVKSRRRKELLQLDRQKRKATRAATRSARGVPAKSLAPRR